MGRGRTWWRVPKQLPMDWEQVAVIRADRRDLPGPHSVVVIGTPPILRARHNGESVTLLWPAALKDHQLQYADSLTGPPNWSTAEVSTDILASHWRRAKVPVDKARFYRLGNP